MSDERLPTLGELDRDGALGAALEGVTGGLTRARLLQGAVLGGATLLAAVTRAPATAEAAAATGDVSILNFALTLEYVQASFYTEVEQLGHLTGASATLAHRVGAHERAHVTALRQALGSRAVARPRFDFRGATEDATRFRATAVAFEDLAVAAYAAQAPRLQSRAFLVSALTIHSVEARHAAWIRRQAGAVPAPKAFDEPRSRSSTQEIVDRTHFVVQTRSRRRPRFTG